MKLSLNWLRDISGVAVEPKKYIADMTMSGSKVETLDYLGAEIKNVVVGRVEHMERHPNSDHLWICRVNVGDRVEQIVTGAQNVNEGDLVPVALDNSDLPGGVHIKKGKLRGEESCGMMCSFQELDLTIHDVPGACENGILTLNGDPDAVPGRDIRQVLGFDDWIVDFEITPNRPDCLSVIGLARESAATFGGKFIPAVPKVSGGAGDINEMLKVRVDDRELCPRYTARIVKNVRIAPSPKWMRQRLHAMGVRPINNIVDITNYVMLEYGQPMHSFDYACLDGGEIVVRRARKGEKMDTLDGQPHTLDADMLVIADREKAVGVAGVMGGANSEITDATKTVVFESANFDGTSIRLTSRRLGMRTDASGRFEKGLDPENTVPAVQRACELIEMLDAGDVCDGMIDIDYTDYKPHVIKLEPKRISSFLGVDIPMENMVKWLEKLDFKVDGAMVTVPSWRGDVQEFADLAEEVARFFGYDNIPTTLFAGVSRYIPSPELQFDDRLRGVCRAMGMDEIQTFSLVSPKDFDKILLPADSPLRRVMTISNPMSDDMSAMRTTMIPSLMDVAARNINVKNGPARLYEMGKVYLPGNGDLPEEKKILAILLFGGSDFFDLKGIVETLGYELGIERLTFSARRDDPSYHPGRCAEVYAGDAKLGVIGQIHPQIITNWNTSGQIYLAQLSVSELFKKRGGITEYRQLARFPAVTRDLALVCAEGVTAAQIEACIRTGAGKLLENLKLFDVYRGEQLGEGKKSLAYTITLRDNERTLTDADSDATVRKILKLLEIKTGTTLRS